MQTSIPTPLPQTFSTGTSQTQTPNDQNIFSEQLCKFCYQTEKQSQEKLISPCGCSGSLKYVHQQCLKKWLHIEANRKEGPLADVNFKFRKPDLKCKLCEKNIIFQNEATKLGLILELFHWISIIYCLKKAKYYACISVLGLLAINYYFLRFFFGKLYKLTMKIKDNFLVSLIIMCLILVLLEVTFIEIKWNSNNLELTIPCLSKK